MRKRTEKKYDREIQHMIDVKLAARKEGYELATNEPVPKEVMAAWSEAVLRGELRWVLFERDQLEAELEAEIKAQQS